MMLRPSTIELNPQQSQLWKEALNQPLTVLDQKTLEDTIWIQQLLMSALGNSEKCLILNFDGQTLDKLQAALQSQHLEDYCATLFDKKNLKDIDFDKNDLRRKKKPSTSSPFETNYQQLLRSHTRLGKKYEALHAPVFDNLSWSKVLGLFLAKQNEQEKGTLSITRAKEGFYFTLEESMTLLKMLDAAQQLYHQVGRLDHPLRQLHAQVFLKKKEYNALYFCQHKIKVYQQRMETMIQKYQQCGENYGQLLRRHLEQQTKVFLHKVDHLLDQIEDKTKVYGARFLDAKLGKIKWYAPILNQGKSAINDYKQLIKEYRGLKKDFERIRWFSFAWPTEDKLKTSAMVKTTLQSFEHALKQGHASLGQFLQEEEVRLNAKSALPELQQSEQINKLEEEMEDLLSEINETQLLDTILENKMLTLSKRKQYLLQVQQQLEQLEQHLSDFPAFYNWQRFWLQQPELHQTLIRSLIENKSKDWSAVFQLWYWEQVLLVKKSIDLPVGSIPLEEYYGFWQTSVAQLPEHVAMRWQDKRTAARQYFKKWKKSQGVGNSSNWQEAELKALSDFYPILVGENLHKGSMPTNFYEALFDWVLVAEAMEEDLKWYQSLGKKVLVFNAKFVVETAEQPDQTTSTFSDALAKKGFWDGFEIAIRPYFGGQRLQRSWQIGDVEVPMVLKSLQEGMGGFVFLQDGFLSNNEVTDFAWEYIQQQKLHEQQWEIIPVWSTACWHNLSEECRKIAAKIISREKKDQ